MKLECARENTTRMCRCTPLKVDAKPNSEARNLCSTPVATAGEKREKIRDQSNSTEGQELALHRTKPGLTLQCPRVVS